jgi:minor extracellular serine protease Vpr
MCEKNHSKGVKALKNLTFTKLFSAFLAFILTISLITPFSNAKAEQALAFKDSLQSERMIELKSAIAEQLSLSKNGPKLHESLKNISGNETVNVIIHLSENPVALEQGISKTKGKKLSKTREKEVRANVKAQQTKVKKAAAAKNVSLTEGYAFDTVLNGFATSVKAKDLATLLTIEGVTLVEPDATVYASEEVNASTDLQKDEQIQAFMDTSISFLGIEELWAEGYEGQGIKVAVLDTGIDVDHPEFAGIYKGGKNFIPHSATYNAPRADDDASETAPSERPANVAEFNSNGSSFYTSHGTHVAGIIAGIGANEFGIKGIAPKVDLYAYRVLGAYGSGSNSGIIKAIETAVLEDMDIINLSLGGGANSETDAGSFAINNAMIAGTIAVIATGNSGPNRGTMGTPSTARLGIAVGNTTNPEATYNGKVNLTIGDYIYAKQLPLMGTTYGKDLATQLPGNYEIVAVPGLGEVKDYANIDVNGKVALISRGSIPFVDKIANAKANGAVAAIIHNLAGGSNAPGISGTFLGDSFDYIPTFDMSQTDGEAIRAALANGETNTINFTNFSYTLTTGDEVNSSSSRGPSTPNYDIKPDVTAPGTNIMSAIPMYKNDFPNADYTYAYARKTGTSMATPQIAGIAALIKQANPDWTPFDVKVALSNTAKVLDTSKYDVFSQGAGRVNAYAAAHPEFLAYNLDTAVLDETGAIVDNIKGTVTFGAVSLKNGAVSVTKQIIVKDQKGNGGNFTVRVDTLKTYGDATVTVDQPTFNLNGEQVINVTLTSSAANAPYGSETYGYIYITSDSSEVSLPFAADFGGVAPTQLTNYRISDTDLSFNGDGIKDTALLSFTLTGDVGTNYIELWDIQNPTGGEYGDGYIGYLHAGSALAKGSYTLTVAGQYRPWSGEPATTIPDGVYTIDLTAVAASGPIGGYVGPVFVKTTKPIIEAQANEGSITGQVTDKYIDYVDVLAPYGLAYNVNTKLKATYVATIEGVEQAAIPFELNQDGSFELPIVEAASTITITVADVAGNVSETFVYEKPIPVLPPTPVVSYEVSQTSVETTIGKEVKVTVYEVTTVGEKRTVKDVTKKAKYKVKHDKIASVKDGVIKGKGEGKTTVTITYNKQTLTVDVTVKKPGKGNDKKDDKGKGNGKK